MFNENEFPYSGGFPRTEKLSPLAQPSSHFQFLDNLEDGYNWNLKKSQFRLRYAVKKVQMRANLQVQLQQMRTNL